jgi:hypothetical protein
MENSSKMFSHSLKESLIILIDLQILLNKKGSHELPFSLSKGSLLNQFQFFDQVGCAT